LPPVVRFAARDAGSTVGWLAAGRGPGSRPGSRVRVSDGAVVAGAGGEMHETAGIVGP